jgi:hypothetical protein
LALTRIEKVTVSNPDPALLWGHHIDLPRADATVEAPTMTVAGWVLGKGAPVVAAEIFHGGEMLADVSLGTPRPDISAAFPQVPEAGQCGFRVSVAVPEPGEGELVLRAVLQDESRVLLGTIFMRSSCNGEEQYGGSGPQSQEASPADAPYVDGAENCTRRLVHAQGPQRRDGPSFRVLAIISTYNEGDVIEPVLEHLASNGINSYLIDNWSTDDTVERALRWRDRGLLGAERFPPDPPEDQAAGFVWGDILKRKLDVSREIEANWYLHHDADEIRESPWPGQNLLEALRLVGELGYNAVGFRLFTFPPVDDGFETGCDPKTYFTRYEEDVPEYDRTQIKCWKAGTSEVVLADGGHEARFDGRSVFPIEFILRHYPIRGQSHGLRKVFEERKPRFAEVERAGGWHLQYDHIETQDHAFVKNPASLRGFDLDRARLEVQLDSRPKERNPEESSTTPTSYEGFLDQANENVISGWARCTPEAEEPVHVDLWDGSRYLGSVCADLRRHDLEEQGTRNGYCGYSIPTPPHLLDGRPHWIWANVAGTSLPLRNSPKAIPAVRRTAEQAPTGGSPA